MSKTQQRIITHRALVEKSYRQGKRYAETWKIPRRVYHLAAFRRGYRDHKVYLVGGRRGASPKLRRSWVARLGGLFR